MEINKFRQIQALTKFNNLVKSKFGDDENKATQTIDNIVTTVGSKYPYMGDSVAILKAYRAAVGEDTWASIASNPSLPALVEGWRLEQSIIAMKDLIAGVRTIFSVDEISDEELQLCLSFVAMNK